MKKKQYSEYLKTLSHHDLIAEACDNFGFYEQAEFYPEEALLALCLDSLKYVHEEDEINVVE